MLQEPDRKTLACRELKKTTREKLRGKELIARLHLACVDFCYFQKDIFVFTVQFLVR